MTDLINTVFGPIMRGIFHPITNALANVYQPWAMICALGMFVGTMIWVYSLRKEYIQIDAPSKALWCDLRLWTVLSMTPHIIVYLVL